MQALLTLGTLVHFSHFRQLYREVYYDKGADRRRQG